MLAQHSQEKNRIRICVQHQDACMNSIGENNNKIYAKIIDNFYFIVHSRIKCGKT